MAITPARPVSGIAPRPRTCAGARHAHAGRVVGLDRGQVCAPAIRTVNSRLRRGAAIPMTGSGECASVPLLHFGMHRAPDRTPLRSRAPFPTPEDAMRSQRLPLRAPVLVTALLIALAAPALAADSLAVAKGTIPISEQPDTAYVKRHIFPLWQEKVRARGLGRELPPPYGVMLLDNWMDSDWRFQSAAVSLGGSNPITIDAASNATMDLNIHTRGVKADLWFLPFLLVRFRAGRCLPPLPRCEGRFVGEDESQRRRDALRRWLPDVHGRPEVRLQRPPVAALRRRRLRLEERALHGHGVARERQRPRVRCHGHDGHMGSERGHANGHPGEPRSTHGGRFRTPAPDHGGGGLPMAGVRGYGRPPAIRAWARVMAWRSKSEPPSEPTCR